MDCLIVGGGLIGLLCARELAREGATVRVIDKGVAGREASWAGGGILSPLYPWRYPAPVTALAHWSQARYEKFLRQLKEETGVDPQWERSGLLILDTGERESAQAWAAGNGVSLQLLEGESITRCEPALEETWSEAFWLPEVAQLRNPRLLKALKLSLMWDEVELMEHTEVNRLLQDGGQVKGVETASGRLLADRVILTVGAWSGTLLPGLRKVEPVQGQMVAFRALPGLLSRIVLNRGYYVIPRSDGVILAGSTVEYRGFDKGVTAEGREQLRTEALKMVPALAEHPLVHHWAGLRPGSQEGIPLIGEHPRIGGLFINTGHFRNGVVTALASARLLTDLIVGRKPIVIPDPYGILE